MDTSQRLWLLDTQIVITVISTEFSSPALQLDLAAFSQHAHSWINGRNRRTQLWWASSLGSSRGASGTRGAVLRPGTQEEKKYDIDKTPGSGNCVKDCYKGQITVQTFA